MYRTWYLSVNCSEHISNYLWKGGKQVRYFSVKPHVYAIIRTNSLKSASIYKLVTVTKQFRALIISNVLYYFSLSEQFSFKKDFEQAKDFFLLLYLRAILKIFIKYCLVQYYSFLLLIRQDLYLKLIKFNYG